MGREEGLASSLAARESLALVGRFDRAALVDASSGALDVARVASWFRESDSPLRVCHVALPPPGGESALRALAGRVLASGAAVHSELWLVDAVDPQSAAFIYRARVADACERDALDARWTAPATAPGPFATAARWLERGREAATALRDRSADPGGRAAVDWLSSPLAAVPALDPLLAAVRDALAGSPAEPPRTGLGRARGRLAPGAFALPTPSRVERSRPVMQLARQIERTRDVEIALAYVRWPEAAQRFAGAPLRALYPLLPAPEGARVCIGAIQLGRTLSVGLRGNVEPGELAWIADGIARGLGESVAPRRRLRARAGAPEASS